MIFLIYFVVTLATLQVALASSDCSAVYPKVSLGLIYGDKTTCSTAGGCWNDAAAASLCSEIPDYSKTDCGDVNTVQSSCEQKGCCWAPSATKDVPWCFYSSSAPCYAPNLYGYSLDQSTVKQGGNTYSANLKLAQASGLFAGKDYTSLLLSIVKESATRTHVKLTPLNDQGNALPVYEVPTSLIPRPTVETSAADNQLTSSEIDSVLELAKSIVYQDQYIQMKFEGPKDTVATYGFGESTRVQQALEFDTHYTLWNTDYGAAGFNASLYGTHPFFMQVTLDGNANGMVFLNSNAIEATIYRANKDPAYPNQPVVEVQSNGGLIDLYLLSGPKPVDVVKQLQEVVGKPSLLPYWSLGLHNCRWGYESLQHVEDVVANYSAANIPLETQWMDIDYMQNYKDFTTDAVKFPSDGMKTFVDKLHQNGQRFVPIVDPGIYAVQPTDGSVTYPALKKGLEQNVFMKGIDGKPYLGQVWPGETYFPDWFATNTTSWWENELNDFHKLVPYDGIWIDMNEVSNFCNEDGLAQTCDFDPGSKCPAGCCLLCQTVDTTNKYDYPVYVPHVSKGSLGTKTVPMSVTHENGLYEYNTHNLFGLMESVATHQALSNIIGKRPFVLSRSTYLSSGRHTAHWTGDNAATWNDLRASIVTMNNFALFGQPNTGADICGFSGNTNEELCARWIEVGSFSVFTRDHNEIGAVPQELYRWDTVAAASRNALAMKYRLLPYLYTLLYKASDEGSTVHNAMWMHYASDPISFSRTSQFMWASGILFTPVLDSGATSVSGYFPKGIWYPLFESDTHGVIDSTAVGTFVTLNTPLEATNAHVCGGNIIPMQGAAMTTAAAKKTPFSLLVALDESKTSKGEVYLDDGEQAVLHNYAIVEFNFCPKSRVLSSKTKAKKGDVVVADEAVVGEVSILGWSLTDSHLIRKSECDATLNFGSEKRSIKLQLNKKKALVADLSEHKISILSEFNLELWC